MADNQNPPAGPDLALGVSAGDFKNDMLLGHVGRADVLLARVGGEFFAIDAHCSHYHGPLAEGLVTGHDVRCPWHHACFDLRTGEAVRAPALSPLSVWKVEQREGRIFVTQKRDAPKAKKAPSDAPRRIVIVGGGAAGFAAAEMLRRDGYGGEITMLSNDSAPPVDRPNLSKDYLAGSAPEDWIPLRPESFYAEAKIELKLATDVASIDAKARHVALADGKTVPYDRLLLATGALADSRRRPEARAYLAFVRRQPRHHRQCQGCETRNRDRRKLHRARGRGVAACPRHRGPCGGAGGAADGAHPRPRHGRLRARAA